MKTLTTLAQDICSAVTGEAFEALPANRFVSYTGVDTPGPYGGTPPMGMNTGLQTYSQALVVALPGSAGVRVAGVNRYDVIAGQAATVVDKARAMGVEIAPGAEGDFNAIDLPVATNENGQAVIATTGQTVVGYTRSIATAAYGWTDENGTPGNNGEGLIGMLPFNGVQETVATYYVTVRLDLSGVVAA
jgi:hypothetical protein